MSALRQPSYAESSQREQTRGILVVISGGGSGGHITPLLAVASKLKQVQPDTRIVYMGEKGGRLSDVARDYEYVDDSYQILAGKLRRYHGEGWKQLLDVPTGLRNIRDVFLTTVGFMQALWYLWRLKPATIFIKGGFVGVPVGLAAAVLRIPYITHDSDSVPGLANRIIAPWARANAVGMPKEFYGYRSAKTFVTGIPLDTSFVPVDTLLMQQYRNELGLVHAEQIIFVTGGGLGAERLNQAIAGIAQAALSQFPHLYLLHGVGRGNESNSRALYSHLENALLKRVIIKDFIPDLYRYSGAADVVVTRGSATALAEFAAQGKACVVVPNPLLTGGHQLKNAEYFSKQQAVVVVTEKQIYEDKAALLTVVDSLLQDPSERRRLGSEIAKLSCPNATTQIVELLLKNIKTDRSNR